MQQKSPYLWFALAVLFAFAAFSWWAYSLVTLKELQYNTLLELIEKEALTEELILETQPNYGPVFSSDTIYLGSRAGALEALKGWEEAYLLVKKGKDNSYHVMPNPSLTEKIKTQRARKRTMYISEGITLFCLICMAIWWVFRSMHRIVTLNTQQNNFMLSVTHELKTPLAGIKLALQTLQRREWEPERRNMMISQAVGEVDRLHALIEDILTGIRIDDKTALNLREENLTNLVNNAVHTAQKRYNGKTIITAKVEEGVTIPIESTAFNLALNNLIDNAIKYSHEDAIVDVSLEERGKEVFISVADQGIGIPPSEHKNVTRKFYRLGDEETRNRRGTGLGLFLTNEIIEKHNGKLLLESNKPKGTIATIKLKRK